MAHRAERMQNLLIEVGTDILHRIKDPAVNKNPEEFVTISDVRVSPDLSVAKFYISVMASPERREEVIKGLEKAAGFFRHELRAELDIKKIPTPVFILDNTLDKAEHIEKLIKDLNIPKEEPEETEETEEEI